MRYLSRKFFTTLVLGLISFALSAAVADAQTAKATKVVGSATVAVPGAGSTALTTGMDVPLNAVITTGAGSEVTLEVFNGATASIKQNSRIVVEKLGVSEG